MGYNTTSLEKALAILAEWDSTRDLRPRISKKAIAEKHGVCRDVALKIINQRERYEARAVYEGLPVGDRLPAQTPNNPLIESTKTAEIGGDRQTGKLDIMLLPDAQVKPGECLEHLRWAGRYAAQKKPDVIVNIGDFADMPSCSLWDEPGSKSYSEQNYRDDILSVHLGMKALMEPIQEEMARSGWKPRFVLTLGNHEDRINRTIEKIPKLDGTIGLPDLEYERWGWEVHGFLKPVTIAGIAFSHYFSSGQMGRPISSAQALLTKKHQSCVAGHMQGRDLKYAYRGDGKEMFALICGSFYRHDEKYLNHQTNLHYRGLYMLYGCEDGVVESPVAVSMNYLERTYGNHQAIRSQEDGPKKILYRETV